MTVVAAISLFNGVMIQADCRLTVTRRGRRPVYCDIVQKIFPVTPGLALGFAGDVYVAALLLPEFYRQLRKRKRLETLSLLNWASRFFRYEYARLRSKHVRPGRFELVFAGVDRSREAVVDRSRVIEILDRFRLGTTSLGRNWIPGEVVTALQSPADVACIRMAGSVAPIVALATSPRFGLRHVRPLQGIAVGSGQGAAVEIELAADWLFAGDDDAMVRMGLQNAVDQFASKSGIQSVGGLYPTLKIDARGLTPMGGQVDLPDCSVAITFDWATRRWTQQNLTLNRSVELLRPDEVIRSIPTADLRFDDYKEAWARFCR